MADSLTTAQSKRLVSVISMKAGSVLGDVKAEGKVISVQAIQTTNPPSFIFRLKATLPVTGSDYASKSVSVRCFLNFRIFNTHRHLEPAHSILTKAVGTKYKVAVDLLGARVRSIAVLDDGSRDAEIDCEGPRDYWVDGVLHTLASEERFDMVPLSDPPSSHPEHSNLLHSQPTGLMPVSHHKSNIVNAPAPARPVPSDEEVSSKRQRVQQTYTNEQTHNRGKRNHKSFEDDAVQQRAKHNKAAKEVTTTKRQAEGSGQAGRSAITTATQPPGGTSSTLSKGTIAERRKAAEEAVIRKGNSDIAEKKRRELELAASLDALQTGFECECQHQRFIYPTLESIPPPPGNTYITHSVMGVVVKIIDTRTVPSGDCMKTIIIGDATTHTAGHNSDDTSVSLFRKDPSELDGLDVGSVVLFRNLKFNSYSHKAKGNGFSNGGNSWYILDGNNSGHPTKPCKPEMERLKLLHEWWKVCGDGDEGDEQAGGGSRSTNAIAKKREEEKKKKKTLEEAKDRRFFDLVAKVIAVYHYPDKLAEWEVYVADGTVNSEKTRNFHGVDPRLPPSATFCLTVFKEEGFKDTFTEGTIIRIPNVRCQFRDCELELKWSNRVTQKQSDDGWKEKEFSILDPSDPQAKEIEKRIKNLRTDYLSAVRQPAPASQPVPANQRSGYAPTIPQLAVAKHIGTTYTDPVKHRVMSICDIHKDRMATQRVRLHAKVTRILRRNARGSNPGDLAVLWCTKCKNPFAGDYCQSCSDVTRARATIQYQMILELDDGEELMYATLSGPRADDILPPLHMSLGGPNEVKRARAAISALTSRVEDVLMGSRMDGVRTPCLIDWTLECYPSENMIKIWRVFGMAKRDM